MPESPGTGPAKPTPPSLVEALVPLALLVLLLAAAFYLYGGDAIDGPIQVAISLATLVAALIALKNGYSVEQIRDASVEAVSTAVGAIFILLSVGALIGSWSMSGTIATLTYYGLEFLDPNWFYLATLVVCAAIALGIGSAWTVLGTIGVALVAVAPTMGLSVDITAGAAISGAYFGDKLSPLSETTNLSPAIAGTDLYSHIKSMMATTIPSIVLAAVIFGVLGAREDPTGSLDLSAAQDVIDEVFNVGIIPLLPLVLVIAMAVLRVPPVPTIMSGALAGGVVAVILQPDVARQFAGEPGLSDPWVMLKAVWSAIATGFVLDSGNDGLDDLVSGGGMSSMMVTVWLILVALAFGGVMQHTGMLRRLLSPLVDRARSDRALVAATGATAIGVNVVAADQYMSIVLTGSIFRPDFERRGISPETLARQIEDTGTVSSPLVPWNSCGAYVSATLGATTAAYFPFCFFNLINIVLSFIYAALGLRIGHVEPGAPAEVAPPEELEDIAVYGIKGNPPEQMADLGGGARGHTDPAT